MLSPKKVRERARRMGEENLMFRSFLRARADDDELDGQFEQMHRELFARYDCCKCNNCCTAYPITLGRGEATRIAQFLGQPLEAFIAEFLCENSEADDEDDGEFMFKSFPCGFLGQDGRCRIQACKPDVCKGFPYTDQPDMLARMFSVISAAEECPVVFEMLERLKDMYNFDGDSWE